LGCGHNKITETNHILKKVHQCPLVSRNILNNFYLIQCFKELEIKQYQERTKGEREEMKKMNRVGAKNIAFLSSYTVPF